MTAAAVRALGRQLALAPGELPWADLGVFPTPITALPAGEGLPEQVGFVKRDDLSSDVYGGNKVRTLEVLFGAALAAGASSIVSTGAYGSNHAVATALHAPRVGLSPGAILFPQPRSWPALKNLRVTLAKCVRVRVLPHFSVLPWAMWREARRHPTGSTVVMRPGGATPEGALGYVSAAFELAEQVRAGDLPAPSSIVVGIGSTCTTAGLLVGLKLAARLGIGFGSELPELVAVRVTPWPVTSRWRILGLAERTSQLIARLAKDAGLRCRADELAGRLVVDAAFLGPGYGRPTPSGRESMKLWASFGLPPLDTTYSAKAAAGFLVRARRSRAPLLFWSTKSSAPLPTISAAALEDQPGRVRRWIQAAERELRDELPAGYQPLER